MTVIEEQTKENRNWKVFDTWKKGIVREIYVYMFICLYNESNLQCIQCKAASMKTEITVFLAWRIRVGSLGMQKPGNPEREESQEGEALKFTCELHPNSCLSFDCIFKGN